MAPCAVEYLLLGSHATALQVIHAARVGGVSPILPAPINLRCLRFEHHRYELDTSCRRPASGAVVDLVTAIKKLAVINLRALFGL